MYISFENRARISNFKTWFIWGVFIHPVPNVNVGVITYPCSKPNANLVIIYLWNMLQTDISKIGQYQTTVRHNIWWRHQMETSSALLALCEGNLPVTGGFPSQRLWWRGALMFWCWASNRDAGDLRRHHAHYDVSVMKPWSSGITHLWCPAFGCEITETQAEVCPLPGANMHTLPKLTKIVARQIKECATRHLPGITFTDNAARVWRQRY